MIIIRNKFLIIIKSCYEAKETKMLISLIPPSYTHIHTRFYCKKILLTDKSVIIYLNYHNFDFYQHYKIYKCAQSWSSFKL